MMQILSLLMTFSLAISATTMAERLGYSAEDRLLIIHADDIGMSHSVNKATANALNIGQASAQCIT